MRKIVLPAAAAALAVLAATPAAAADDSLGKREFETRCAMCHGVTGKGDGWLADYLMKRPPALTQLKKNNGGVFPLADVIDIIDGRKAVKVHGPREMPVWGTVYQEERKMANEAGTEAPADTLRMTRSKLRALAYYISRLQE